MRETSTTSSAPFHGCVQSTDWKNLAHQWCLTKTSQLVSKWPWPRRDQSTSSHASTNHSIGWQTHVIDPLYTSKHSIDETKLSFYKPIARSSIWPSFDLIVMRQPHRARHYTSSEIHPHVSRRLCKSRDQKPVTWFHDPESARNWASTTGTDAHQWHDDFTRQIDDAIRRLKKGGDGDGEGRHRQSPTFFFFGELETWDLTHATVFQKIRPKIERERWWRRAPLNTLTVWFRLTFAIKLHTRPHSCPDPRFHQSSITYFTYLHITF